MAISPRLITLNFGSQTVGLAEFRVQAHGGLVLLDYRLREAPLDLRLANVVRPTLHCTKRLPR